MVAGTVMVPVMVREVVTMEDLARLTLLVWPVNMTTAPASKLEPRNVTLPFAPAAIREGVTPALLHWLVGLGGMRLLA